MSAYVIVEIEVHDPERYEEYRRQVPELVAKYGGRYLVRGGRAELLEGLTAPRRIVVLEFPSFERAKEWWSSEEYGPVRKIREESADARMILVEGC